MKKGCLLALVCQMWISPNALADYYLKFETSGASHDPETLFSANTNTWMRLSIVDTYPTNGPVHYPHSRTGAFTKIGGKSQGVDHTFFYVADVPRSVTIVDKSDGSRARLDAGQTPVTYPGAPSPAFLMPDALLVTTGLSQDYDADVFKVFLAATMPVTAHTDRGNPFGVFEKNAQGNYRIDYNAIDQRACHSGWGEAGSNGGEFVMLQIRATDVGISASRCHSSVMSKGAISHVILFK